MAQNSKNEKQNTVLKIKPMKHRKRISILMQRVSGVIYRQNDGMMTENSILFFPFFKIFYLISTVAQMQFVSIR